MARNIGRPVPAVPAGGLHDAQVQRDRKTVIIPSGKTMAGVERLSVGPGTRIVDLSFDATETDVDAGGAPLPGTTIIPGTSYGQSPSVGTSTKYMREDATAGTPPSPLTFMPRIVFSGGRADTVFDGKVHVLVRCGGA